MTDGSLVEPYGLYQLEDGTVVRVVGERREEFTLARFDDGRTFTARRDNFERLVRDGYVQQVTPTGWCVVGDSEVSEPAT